MNYPTLLLPPPPPVQSVDTQRMLASSARRRETAAIRERWKQQQAIMTSRIRAHPTSTSRNLSASSTQLVLANLRKKLAKNGYGRRDRDSTSPPKQQQLQFPQLEQELTKRNLTERLPYHVSLDIQSMPRMDYPTKSTSYSDVFFLSTPRGPSKDDTNPDNRRCKSAKQERFFIHPEWASEEVAWKRMMHRSTPDHFRYSWM